MKQFSRVALVLAIADQCIEQLRYSEKVYNLTANALRDAWKWEQGEPIHGDLLDYYLENPEEESLAVYGCDPPTSSLAAIMAITSAVAYVAWHAYKKDGITAISSTIHEVSESVLDEVVDYATSSPRFDATFIDRVSRYLVEKCGISDPEQLGQPVTRQMVLDACRR
jgi:hypothetical protein